MADVHFVPMRVSVLEATRPYTPSKYLEFPVGLVTLDVTIPGFVQRELLTHKRLSRSFVSARAMSAERLAALGYYMPRHFHRQGPGMSSSDEVLVGIEAEKARRVWKASCIQGLRAAMAMKALGVAKEQANRVMCTDARMFRGAVTATESGWSAFFKLRYNDEGVTADRAMSEFAGMCRDAINGVEWSYDRCHVPYLSPAENQAARLDFEYGRPGHGDSLTPMMLISGARVARMSYDRPGEGKYDDELADTLLRSGHWSAFEHQAEWVRDPRPSAIVSRPDDVARDVLRVEYEDGSELAKLATFGWESLRASYGA